MSRLPANEPFCGNCTHHSKIPYNQHGYAWCDVLNMNVSACDPKCRQFVDRSPKAVKQRCLRLACIEAIRLASI